MIYLDTSIIAPFYWAEALSETVEQLLRIETEPGISQLVEVEMFSALSRRVSMGEISQDDARKIVERFQADIDSSFYTCFALEPVHYHIARDWIGRFETPLRTLDALHLAIAALNDLCLLTADEALFVSAEVFGVKVQIIRPESEEGDFLYA